MSDFKTVVVNNGETAQLGFEVERAAGGLVVVCFPDTPLPRAKSTAIVLGSSVQRIDISPHEAMDMLKFVGKGMGNLLTQPGPLPCALSYPNARPTQRRPFPGAFA